ncbi:hypothetical protein F52700_4401 [Fusarium sp. NRRL 52700]|nr:hypothetical protein F52700_4401 [Fusarium sp. NRRL 52700]
MANNTLSVGETLIAESFLTSTNNRFKLLVQKDGNLVLYRLSTGFNGQEVMAAQWASDTWRETDPSATELTMQEDGDLVLFQSRPGREVAWSTKTGGRDSRDAYVMLNDNESSGPSPNLLAGIDVGKLIISGIVQGLSTIEGGWLITGIAGLIWPDLFDETPAAMRALEEGLKDFARDLIDQKSIETLRKKTRGLVDAYRQYDALSPGEDKAEWLNALLVWFATNREFYCDTDSPAKTLPYFVTMATMHLAVLRDRCYRYREITKREPNQHDLGGFKAGLEKAIAECSQMASVIRRDCMKWRLSQVQDGEEWTSVKSFGDSATTTKLSRNLIRWVTVEYQRQLDEVLAPTYHWDNFRYGTPEECKLVKRNVSILGGPWGDGSSTNMECWDDAEQYAKFGRITRIDLYSGNDVEGLEVWYGGHSSGLRGSASGTRHVLEIAPNESIVYFSGTAHLYVQGLKFFVRSDKNIGGGVNSENGGSPSDKDTFHMGHKDEGGHPDGLGCRLDYLYGVHNHRGGTGRGAIEQIGAVFHYTEKYNFEV